jgi:hypothetical protein
MVSDRPAARPFRPRFWVGIGVEHVGLGPCVRRLALTVGSDGSGVCRRRRGAGGGGEEGAEELLGGALQGPHPRGHDARLPRRRARQGGAPGGDAAMTFFNLHSVCFVILFCLNLESMSMCHVFAFASQISRWQSLRGTRGETNWSLICGVNASVL